MTSTADRPQGARPLSGASLPGNVGCNEEFPDFCLHHDHHSAGSQASTSSPASTTPTTPTTAERPLSSAFSTTSENTSSPASSTASRVRTDSGASTNTNCSPSPRSRRDKTELQAARLQRSGSSNLALARKSSVAKKNRFRSATGSSPASALAAVEPPHDQGLTRMAFAEQQKWITVQQKTFTKWYDGDPFYSLRERGAEHRQPLTLPTPNLAVYLLGATTIMN